jgi:hypothetical protein
MPFEWLDSIDRTSNAIPLLHVLIAMVGSAVLSTILGWVYLKVNPTKEYGRSLVLTQVTLAVVISSVLMMIGDSVAVAFGAFGILSVVRFRTNFPDPRDTASILSAIAVGMACGLREFRLALVATLVMISIQGLGWLWLKDADEKYWRDIAMRGRGEPKEKKKKEKTANEPATPEASEPNLEV